ncbi:hypothetical protein GCM10023074_23330 [Microbispora amethystogenes]|uniref:Uncharacterized protein n=2 Tax=Microbispora amethystogenes TaxID=1427754 RepID=A0ABQ4F905_9ACTN|nr:hypothetical protein Mam01_14460 [Microbispora amethystogenes]
MLQEIGVLALSILKNLNLERNAMEHDYRVPALGRVQETIDVLDLLVSAFRNRWKKIPYECVVGLRDGKSHGLLRLDPLEGCVSLHLVNPPPKTLAMQHGIETIWTPVRGVEGKIFPHFEVNDEPAWKYPLKFDNKKGAWTPWLR